MAGAKRVDPLPASETGASTDRNYPASMPTSYALAPSEGLEPPPSCLEDTCASDYATTALVPLGRLERPVSLRSARFKLAPSPIAAQREEWPVIGILRLAPLLTVGHSAPLSPRGWHEARVG